MRKKPHTPHKFVLIYDSKKHISLQGIKYVIASWALRLTLSHEFFFERFSSEIKEKEVLITE